MKTKKTRYPYMIPAVLFLVVLMILIMVGINKSFKDASNPEEQEIVQEDERPDLDKDETIEAVSFPYELESGKLIIMSLFQSDVPNPDKDFEEGKNLATIEVVNNSQQYLVFADFVLTMADNTQITFRAEDIPAGKKAWAFELDNTAITADIGCVSIDCTAEFLEGSTDWSSKIKADSSASLVTITNLTDETMAGLKATFHCLLEDTYFGGLSIKYNIEELLPQETRELEVIECYLGDAELVLIEP